MENLTHTLFGLSLAKAGLERTTPLATTTLVISSNLPDIDSVTRLRGTLYYLEYHRGYTHSFVGLAALAALFTLGLTFVDNRFRTRRDPFRRPIRPVSIFLLACLGGLGHTFMDFGNSYGVRPLLPFSDGWFYGDLTFVADPWIWLILGPATVWLTTRTPFTSLIWIALGTALCLLVALAFRDPANPLMAIQPSPIPQNARLIWFVGFTVLVAGALLRWGRAGPRLARYSLVVLTLYYLGMWSAKLSALEQARNSPPVPGVISISVWPEPANPLFWQSVASTTDSVYARHIDIGGPGAEWQRMAALDSRFVDALRQSRDGRGFLDFARYVTADVEQLDDGYAVSLRDLRFPLRMNAKLSADLAVLSTDLHWF